jgi:GT2 family glycosyltransferase
LGRAADRRGFDVRRRGPAHFEERIEGRHMRAKTTSSTREEKGAGRRWLAAWFGRDDTRVVPAASTPRISVVIPVYNAAATLGECLNRLFQSRYPNFEVVIVDDGSTDATRRIAAAFPCRIVPSGGRVGPAAARNVGAQAASGELIFFIDADVMVRPDSLAAVAAGFERLGVDGLIGLQSREMRHRDLCSQYKNLWMRYTYEVLDADVPLFYTTAAAIRRSVFLASGGFDVGYGGPNVEDTDFGQKLQGQGYRVRVLPDLEVEHVKAYSLAGLLRTDWHRAVALTRLKLRKRGRSDLATNDTSVPSSYVWSIPTAGVAAVAAMAYAISGWSPALVVGTGAAAAVMTLNRGFLGFIWESEGVFRGMGASVLMLVELLVSGAGACYGAASYTLGRRY